MNAYAFNLRTRVLNSMLNNLIQIPTALFLGWLLVSILLIVPLGLSDPCFGVNGFLGQRKTGDTQTASFFWASLSSWSGLVAHTLPRPHGSPLGSSTARFRVQRLIALIPHTLEPSSST